MKLAAACLGVALGSASLGALTQGVLAQGAGDPMDKLRSCSQLPQAERLQCLEKLSRDMATPPPTSPSEAARNPASSATAPRAADNWIVSETTSPIDYSPIATATASSGARPDDTMQLSIRCRGGRMDLVIANPALVRRNEDYVVSYAVNDEPPANVAAAAPASGPGIAIKGDVARLLTAMPDQGLVVFRVVARPDATIEGRYALPAMKAVLTRLATPCKAPPAAPARN